MKLIGKLIQYTLTLVLSVGLVFASGVFGISLYVKAHHGRDWTLFSQKEQFAFAAPAPSVSTPSPSTAAPPAAPPVSAGKKTSVLLDAPIVRQNPELPAGCEITSLSMLLQYYGLMRSKLELANEMPLDQTGLTVGPNGSIVYWGNPNLGYVGDIYGKARGFGIYHTALINQLKKDVPSAVDLTGKSFDDLEHQLSEGFPVLAWTTIDYTVPKTWVQWDTEIGPIRTTFAEHAVLLVGYDADHVYVNDPFSGKKAAAVDKPSFIASWDAMGRQSLSYTQKKE